MHIETRICTIVPLNEEVTLAYQPEREPSIFEMIQLIAEFPLRYQVILMCNLLTISGFTEKELAEQIGMPYLKYRQLLSVARKEFKNNKTKEI